MSLIGHHVWFYGSEVRLMIGGPQSFFVALAARADTEMIAMGGIRPFSYECRPEGWGLFKLTVNETGRTLRTDAQRALVKAKAATRRRTPGAQRTSPGRGRSA